VSVLDAETGDVLRTELGHNKVPTAGLNVVRDLLTGDSSAVLSTFRIGTDDTAEADGDTALGTQVNSDSFTQTVKNSAQIVYSYLLASGDLNVYVLKEAGIFFDDGTIFNRFVYADIDKSSAIQVLYQVTIDITEA